ncbi:peptidoglycan-binding domain-containing protein [Streptomyces longispororuber]|uniref:peptidoglycan-binding domain-containing protein n=1 Tax=Streptomyces longispororuber TaxID=68230 RepID=UPI0036FCBE0D
MRTKHLTALTAAALGSGLLTAPTAAAADPLSTARLPLCEYAINQPTDDGYMVRPGVRPGNYTCLLKQGHRMLGVKALQAGLRRCYGARITVDMTFGPATKKALRAAQRRAGIPADGIFGPTTSYALRWPEYTPNGRFTGRCIRN